MKAILFFIFLSGCGLNAGLVNSIGEQAKEVIDKAKSQGGQAGIQTLNDEIQDLEDKIDKKESEYRRLKNRIDDKEDELDEKQDELDDVEKRLREIEDRLNEGGLTPEEIQALKDERDRLQSDKTTLEQEKQQLQDQIAGLSSDKERLETERDQAKADLEAVKQARDDLQRQLDRARTERDNALESAKQARDGEGRQKTRADKAETDRDCWRDTRFNFCTRSRGFRDKVAGIIGEPCGDINICDLKKITSLDFSSPPPTNNDSCVGNLELKPDDFEGFTKLETLDFSGTCLSGLEEYTGSEGFFNGLNSLRTIDLQEARISKLSESFFNGLSSLQEVKVNGFIVCGSYPDSFKSKLRGSFTFTTDHEYRNMDMSAYCY